MEEKYSSMEIKELIELSKSIDKKFYDKVHFNAKSHSIILNPVTPRGMRVPISFSLYSLADHKRLLDSYITKDYTKNPNTDELPRPCGILPHAEWKLRELYRQHEHLERYSDNISLPGGGEAKTIIHQAVLVKICQEEVKKLEKVVSDLEFAEEKKHAEVVKTAKHRMIGGFKRDEHGKIKQIDGMDVLPDGTMPDAGGVHFNDYLAKCREHRQAAKAASRVQSVTQ